MRKRKSIQAFHHNNPYLRLDWCRTSIVLSCVLFIILILCIIPIIWIGQYCHPASDDFSYGTFTAIALRERQSLLSAVLYTIKRYYFGWQGTFSAAAMMSIVPCIWNEKLYALTPIIMLSSLLLGTFKLLDTIIHRILHGSRYEVLGVGSVLLILSIEFLPSPIESFYWWNGAVFYTFTYGIMLLFIDRLIVLLFSGTKKWFITISAFLLAIYIGGNNYVTALFYVELCFVFLIYCVLKRKDIIPHAVLIFFVLAASFLTSALAPGNSVRQSGLAGLSPIQSILTAICQAGTDILTFSSPAMILIALISIPFLWKLAQNTNFSFKHPLLVQLFSFLLYTSQNTPHFFAASTAGPGRLRNIVYFSFLWLLLLSLFYWIGFFQKHASVPFPKKIQKPVYIGLCFILLVCVIQNCYHHEITSAEAIYELKSGSAEQFDREQTLRFEAYQNPDISDIEVAPLSVRPELLFWSDLSPDINDWANIAMSNYYQKNTFKLID